MSDQPGIEAMHWVATRDRPRCFIDIETNGLNPTYHSIMEVAAEREDFPPFVSKVRGNMRNAEPQALEVIGYSEEEWKDAPTWGAVGLKLYRYVAGSKKKKVPPAIVVAHNAYDMEVPWLKMYFAGIGLPWLVGGSAAQPWYARGWGWPVIDTMALAATHLCPRGLKNVSLSACLVFLNQLGLTNIAPELTQQQYGDGRHDGLVHRAYEGVRRCRAVHDAICKLTGSERKVIT